MSDRIIIACCPRVRLRVRRVDEHALAARTLESARESGKPAMHATDGGSVCNTYGWRAETEGAVCVAFPSGEAIVWIDRLPANKVTRGGVAASTVGYQARPLWDDRYRDETRLAAARGWLLGRAVAELAA